jgi:predicted RNA binding protein YcfA (HicA-like mRNA interferase family)
MTGKALIKLLLQNGWEITSISGSHHKLKKGGRSVVVPVHANRDLKTGTEDSILKKAGLK